MLLLTDSISKEDSCWELRLRCGELGAFQRKERRLQGAVLAGMGGEEGNMLGRPLQSRCVVFLIVTLPFLTIPSSQPFPHGCEH